MTGPVGRATAAQAAVGFLVAGLGGGLTRLADDLDVPLTSLGWMSSAFGLGLLAVGALAPLLLRRGPGPVLAPAALVAAIGAALLGTSSRLAPAAVGVLLLGVGAAGLVLVTPALLRGADTGRLLARVVGVSSLAGILAPPALAVVGRPALLLAVAPLVPLLIRSPPPGPAAAPSGGPRGGARATRWWVCVVLAVGVEFCFAIWAVARLRQTGLDVGAATAASTAFVAGAAVGRLAGQGATRSPLLLPASCLAVVAATAVLVAVSDPVGVTTALFAAGVGVALLYPVTLDRLVASLPAAAGPGAGALAAGTAVLLAPAGLGLLATSVDLRLAQLAVVVPLCAALVLLAAVSSRGAGDPAPP